MTIFPFTLDGPGFLFFFGAGIVFNIIFWVIASAVIRNWASSAPRKVNLDLYATAWLSGGARACHAAATLELARRGYLEIDGSSWKAVKGAGSPEHPVEIECLRGAALPPERRLAAFAAAALPCEATLIRAGLLLPSVVVRKQVVLMIFSSACLLLVGLLRCLQGLAAGRPIFFLVLLMIVFFVILGVAVSIVRGFRRTEDGNVKIRDLRKKHESWKKESPDEQELPLAISLFGLPLLVGTAWSDWGDSIKQVSPPVSSVSFVSGCGTSCGTSCGGDGGGDGGGGGCGGGGGD